jgi:hypothetical protein
MVSRRELGDDSAVGGVELDLRVHDVARDAARLVDDRRTGLVAR